jgi:hypothetical protein
MRKLLLIIPLTLYTNFVLAQNNCICDNGLKKIYKINEVLVCGHIEEQINSKYKLKSLTVLNCTKNEFIVNYDGDEITPFSITFQNDTIILVEYHYAPIGDNWEMSSFPFERKYIISSYDSIQISKPEIIFDYPNLTNNQIKDINNICRTLEHYTSNERKIYPLEYESIYILFIGAYKNISNSREIYRSIRTNFILDGAVAETYGEIHFDSLIKE